jgi:tetratricopeptide (TPR) repeat protein
MTAQFRVWYHLQTAKLAYRRGCNYSRQTNYLGAITAFNQALERYPRPAEVYVERGLSYRQLGNLTDAFLDFNRAIELDPENARAYGNRGLLRYEYGDEAGALVDWETALAHWPTYADAYYNRALVYISQEKLTAALADLDQVLVLKPNWSEAYFHRGNLRQRLGDQEGAIHDWELAVCNDLTFTAAQAQLQSHTAEEHRPDYVRQLTQWFTERNLEAHIGTVNNQIEITVHRQVGTGVNYFTLPALIRQQLVPLELPAITRFTLIGKVGEVKSPEWSQTYDLYKGQPCPPSHWQSALSTLLTFPPFGVTALIYAAQVKDFYQRGNYPDALHASKNVKRLCLTGAGLLCFLAMMPLGYMAIASMKTETQPPERTARSIDSETMLPIE